MYVVSGSSRTLRVSTDVRMDGRGVVVIAVMAVEVGMHERRTPRAHLQGGAESRGDQSACHWVHCSGSVHASQGA